MFWENGSLSRRGFLQRSLGIMAAAGLPAWFAHEIFAFENEKKERKPGPNDAIIMGAIGIGSPQSRGRAIKNDAMNVKAAGVRYVAVCDADKRHRDKAAEEIGNDCAKYEDFRELLDRKDIDAVTIAVPDHWHALIAIDALRKGKNVYCEKPLTLTIAEGIAVAKVAKETGKIFQVGSQQRSSPQFRLACELVRNGRLGKITQVETRIGSNPQSPSLPKVDVPEGLNWDLWLGPTPKVDYAEAANPGNKNAPYTRCHYEFRWWYDYSGGKMTDWGAHHNDIAQWGLGMDESGPVAIEAEGAAPSREPNSYNCHPTFKITYTYGNGAKLVCAHTQMEGSLDPKQTDDKGRKLGHDNGILFIGEGNKWIFVNRGGITASDPKLIEEPLPEDRKVKLYVSNNHMENFLVNGVKNGNPCICPAEVGHRSVTVCHLGVIALRSGKKLNWDPVKQQFDDKDANKWLSREMRKPWKLEV
jgi:predicted dehydrogenase